MTNRRELWIVALLTLVAFALRLIDLDARSLWLDESFTLLRVNGSWAEMIANTVWRQGIFTTDLNPPLYFALLKGWSELAGLNTFVLRLFSAFWAILIVPLTYVLARRLFKARVALMATTLALLCPTYQWYAAELRMYSMMACLGAVSTYLLHRALTDAQRRGLTIAAWLIATALALFTHFSFISLTVAQIVFVLIALLPRLRSIKTSRALWIGLGASLVVLLLALVLFGTQTAARAMQLANNALSSAPKEQGASLLDFVQEIISAMAFGLNAGDPMGGWLTVLIGVLIVLGVALPLNRQRLSERTLLAIVVVTPIVFWLALSYFIENSPSFRYVIFIFPALHVLIAHAIDELLDRVRSRKDLTGLTRWASALAGVAALAVVFGASLHGVVMSFTRTPTWQDDWRGLANHVRQNWQPGDVLVINLNTPEAVLPLGLRDLPIQIVPARDWLMRPTDDMRREINEAYGRVWYANTGGDGSYQNRDVHERLSAYLLRERTSYPSRTTIIELLEYDVHPLVVESLPATTTPVPDAPMDITSVVGYEIEGGNPYHRNTNFRLALYWRRGDDDLASHTVSVRLKYGEQLWLDWTFNAKLTTHPVEWSGGKLYRVSTVVPVPPGLPVQPYQLEMQVRAGDKGEVVQSFSQPLDPSDFECCMRIVRSNEEAERWRAGDVTLAIAEYPDVLKPGEPLPIALTWRPNRDDLLPWQTELKLEGLLGGEVASTKQDVGTPAFSADAWPTDELARDQYSLQLPYTVQPGWYRLSLNRWRDGKAVDGTMLGLVRIEDYPRTPAATQVQHPVNARVGEMGLLGYGVNVSGPIERGKTYDFITHWRVEQTPQRDGVLTLHVFNSDGQSVSQDDNPPLQGKRSTLTYRAGDGIDQIHRITIPANLPAGEYQLYAGIYDREGGLRWPAQQDGQPAKDDFVRVGSITLP